MPPTRMGSMKDYEVLDEKVNFNGPFGVCKKIRRKMDDNVLIWFEMNYGAMDESELASLVSRVNLLRQLRHPHVLRHYDLMQHRPTTTVYVVVEYCEGGDLRTLIKRCRCDRKHLDEEFIWKVIWHIGCALHEFSNVEGMLRCNLEPANVFMDANSNVKLSGLDFAAGSTSFLEQSGVSCYVPPEQTNKHGSGSEKSDVWAMGCLVHELCSLVPPFTAESLTNPSRTDRQGLVRRIIPPIYSGELDALIHWMLTVEVDRRPSMEMVMHHPRLARFQSQRRQNQPPDGSLRRAATRCKETRKTYRGLPEDERLTSTRRHRDIVELKLREQKLIENEKHLNNREEELNRKEEHFELIRKELDDREEELNKLQKKLILDEELIQEKYKRFTDYLMPSKEMSSTIGYMLNDLTGNARKTKSSRGWTSSSSSRTSMARHHVQKKLWKAKRVRFAQAELDGTVDRENETSMEEDVRALKEYRPPAKENRSAPIDVSFNTRFGTLKTRIARAQRRALRLRTAEIESRMRASLII